MQLKNAKTDYGAHCRVGAIIAFAFLSTKEVPGDHAGPLGPSYASVLEWGRVRFVSPQVRLNPFRGKRGVKRG